MQQPSTFRMIPNTAKQRIFVVKSNMNSRYIQNVITPKQEVFETITLNNDPQNRRVDSNEAAKNAQIDRLMNLPSNLSLKSTDTPEQQVLNDLVHKASKNDQSNEMHRTVVLRNQNSQPQPNLMPKKYCTFRPIEEKLQPYVERLRAEINKRRHRVEIECANDLGLNSPWRRTRYHRKTPKYEEEQRQTGPINPSTISLNFDGQSDNSQMHNSYDHQQFNSQSPYYTESPQQISSGNNIIVGGNDQSQQHYYNEISNEDRSAKKFKPELERCPVCTRECRKTLFCLCCGLCNRRFHGKCVKMTVKRLNKRQGPWLCDDCINVPMDQPHAEDLFCVCKKPYDNKEFYVGCDSCDGWFHPACVGTSQQEIENIEGGAFFCPNCQRRNSEMMHYGYAG